MDDTTIKSKKEPYTRITDSIILIHQDSMKDLNFNSCNCYLVEINDGDYAIIDPGASKKKFARTLRYNEINYEMLKYIYLTHGHSDHVALLDFLLKKNPELEVFIHTSDKDIVENSRTYFEILFNLDLLATDEKFTDFLNSIDYYSGINTNQEINPYFKTIFDIWNVKNRVIDHTFTHGEILPGNLEVVHAPGHTKGMCFFLYEPQRILFSADIHLSPIGASMAGKNVDVNELKKSTNLMHDLINRKAIQIILSGHGKNPIDNNLDSRVSEFYNSIIKKEQQIMDILRDTKGLTLEQITKETFKTFLKRVEKYLENQAFKDTIVIAEVSELTTNYNLLKELNRLNRVSRKGFGKNSLWVLKEPYLRS